LILSFFLHSFVHSLFYPSFVHFFLNVSVLRFFVSFLLISLTRGYDSSLVVGVLMFVTFVFGFYILSVLTFEVFVFDCITAQPRGDEREGQNAVL
jgi:hypothetical protein